MLITVIIYVAGINFFPAFADSDVVLRNKRSDEYVPFDFGWYYFCFSDSENVVRIKRSDDYVPCEFGWYYFRGKCYRIGGRKSSERQPWDGALSRCKSYGGDLVSIQSQEEQDFIISFLQLQVKSWVWTGLNDRDRESDFRWTDGSAFNYTNWKSHQPDGIGAGGEEEDCVHMFFAPETDIIGQWNDRACEIPETYVCEKTANPRKRSPNPVYCSAEEGGGWKYESSCYHVVTERMSWQNAETHCRHNYNGHLVTILDTLQDFYLNHILADLRKELWIGIKIQNHLQQKWSSGWYVSYNGFDKEQIIFREGSCIARKRRKEWITIPCKNKLPFICETSKVSAPVPKSPPRGSHCPIELDDWRDLGGEYCYYYETEKERNFYEASFDCKRRGGNLVSVHSKEESDILFPFVKYVRRTFFIGLIRILAREEEFAWTDGSAVNFENWKSNEPNNVDEKCAEVLTHDDANGIMFSWNDISCEEKRGYICSVKKILPNSTFAEEKDCTSFCIAQSSYLHEIVIQSSDAKRLP